MWTIYFCDFWDVEYFWAVLGSIVSPILYKLRSIFPLKLEFLDHFLYILGYFFYPFSFKGPIWSI